jgi:formylglycine-generating enzyme required for sulfatase activity
MNFVSIYDAMRFVNWLHNGQPEGAQDTSTTEDGAYEITAAGIATNAITRRPGALYSLPDEDEWYKAAYYDPVADDYLAIPSRNGVAMACGSPAPFTARANCGNAVGDVTPAGSYTGSVAGSGTLDQGGNVWEWTETASSLSRRIRGGSYESPSSELRASDSGTEQDPQSEEAGIGFRVVPEPHAFSSILAGTLVLIGLRRLRSARSRTRRSAPRDAA